jgi:hypothetical protein
VCVLLLDAGDERIAIDVFPQPEVSGLERAQSEHHEDIKDLGKERFGPSLDRIRKDRHVIETSVHTDKRTKAKWTEIFRHGCQDDVKLLVPEVNFSPPEITVLAVSKRRV